MIGNEKSFTWALDGSLLEKIRHRGEADLSRTIRDWRQLGIDLVLLVDSGQGMALEFLARDLVLQGMPVHLLRLEELFADGTLQRFRQDRLLILHAESSESLARSLKGDPVLDTPPLILRASPTTARPARRTAAPQPAAEPPARPAGKVVPFPNTQESSPAAPVTEPGAPVRQSLEPPTISVKAEPVRPARTPEAASPSPIIAKEVAPAPLPAAPVAPPPPPSSPPRSYRSGEMGISRWNIRVKTIAILSGLIVVALSTVIFFASSQFTEDMGATIQADMRQLNEVVGQRVQVILEQTRYGADLIAVQASSQVPMAGGEDRNADLFRGNPDLLAILLTEPQGESLSITRSLQNREQMELSGLTPGDTDKILSLYGQTLSSAQTGATVVVNASPGFRQPIIAMSFPSQRLTGRILVLVINARRIGESFLGGGLTTTFMVDRTGSVLAHPDANNVLSGEKVADLPVFTTMMKSTTDTQVLRFFHNDKWHRGSFKKLPMAGLGVISTVEEDQAFKQVTKIRNRNLALLGIVLSVAVLVGYFFARSLALPLRELVGATRRVEAEDYSVQVEPRSRDEVGALAASFNKMVHGLAERERMKDAFGRFVNKEVAERAMRGEIKLGGEKKECAVFFSDLRGFTSMSEKMQPEEVVDYLNRYFTLMVDCVDRSGGAVDKFIGDAVMATWGSVTSSENDTANAVDGALMMRHALLEFNKFNAEHGRPIAKFGCGINSGAVISGQIGSEKRLEFTVIGDAVNLASRIESLNKPFATDILISEDAWNKVQGRFEVVKMPAIRVKGKSSPQTIYAVLGRVDDPNRPKNLEELRRLAGIDWKSKAESGDVFEEEKEEKYEIIEG